MREASCVAMALVGLGVVLVVAPSETRANGWQEDHSWQFQTPQDMANLATVATMMQLQRGGYYDSFKPANTTNNILNTTNIEKQVNCSVGASAVGNSGTNGMTASASSPSISNSGSTGASSLGNTSTNSIGGEPKNFVLASTSGGTPGNTLTGGAPSGGTLSNGQTNSGAQNSSVSNSPTSISSGTVSAGGGTSSQVLNSSQSNTAGQTASIANSQACVGGPLN